MNKKIADTIQKYEYYVVASCIISVYFLIVLPFGYYKSLNTLMFWMPDAQFYRNVGDWILGIKNTANPLITPFLYPLLIVITKAAAGSFGIWCFQFVLWICSGVLVYRDVKITTQNPYLAIAGVAIYTGNITLLLLTFHALTEITVIFLLTILVSLVIDKRKLEDIRYWALITFIISLLTITKPVYIILWVVILIYQIPIIIYDAIKHKLDRLFFVYFVLALLPVLIQISLMKIYFNEFTLSNIGPITFKNYYLARVFGEVNSISLNQAREMISAYTQIDVIRYVVAHFATSLQVYIKTVLENILARSDYVNLPLPNIYLFIYMRMVNVVYFALHVVMLLPITVVLIKLYRRKNFIDLKMILSLIIPLLLIVLTSGITFSQGDRIVLPGLPIWIVLYSAIISKYQTMKSEKS